MREAKGRKLKHMLPAYPKDHPLGMVVPVGGSDCAKCEHISEDQKNCDEAHFIKWNGSKKLPAPADRYCCDFWEGKTNNGS